jgi:hypothetical protein
VKLHCTNGRVQLALVVEEPPVLMTVLENATNLILLYKFQRLQIDCSTFVLFIGTVWPIIVGCHSWDVIELFP